ncbi:MAG: GGDEF domain-containing phosphodiesterase [Lachnospiraceae bacterium]|nr:GGDEF domain-containing phosphodiesterase [Lachnospiraceae bacterium]
MWGTIVFCIIMAIVSDVFISVFASFFITYIFDSKAADEYEAVSYMARMYDMSDAEKDGNVYSMLNEDGRTYFITDDDGNIIYQNGENTIGTTNGFLEISVFSRNYRGVDQEKVRVYMDNLTEGIFVPDEQENLEIDFPSLLRLIRFIDNKNNLDQTVKKTSVEIPVWIAINVKDGKQTFFGKAGFSFSLYDVLLIMGFIAAGIALVVIIILLMLVSMISSLRGQKRMVTALFSDPITRAHNWLWFTYKGEQILKKKRSLKTEYAVIDLVFVKYRNYCVCHSVSEGSEMLCRVDKILRNNIDNKELAAHYASANFALLLKFSDREELQKRLEKIISQLEQIDSDHKFTFHLGVYVVDKPKDKNGKTVKRKDVDMEIEYNNACTARSTLVDNDNSGIAFFDEELIEEQKWIDKVMENYSKAIENEEFIVYYQPKYDPKTDELRGVEALIRWDSPEFGFKSPGTFIPILEKNGLIPEIDHYMITHVSRDQKAWLDAGLKCVPASVNVSRAHFIEKDLALQIREAVDDEGAPHELIEIEVTESAFFDDKKVMIDTIRQLKEFGFQVSMDDFGSGYSSLNSLKDMPLDVLKLDAEFFRGDLNDDRGEIVVSEAIKLAKNLKMLTVAEGVEEKEQVEFLAKQGCDMIQGYFYARPMPKDEFAQRMTKTE